MPDLKLEKLNDTVSGKVRSFAGEILSMYKDNIHSIHVVGSAVTPDFDEKSSDINSIFVLKSMDLKFIEVIAPLGKKYRKKFLSAPLVMTPLYIERSLDVFPIEFYNFKIIHETVYGDDLLRDLEFSRSDLRHQCEREIKSKLIWLRQSYLSSLGDRQMLTERFINSISGYMTLFRGIIFLMDREPPIRKKDVITSLSKSTGINTDVFMHVLDMKKGILKPDKEQLTTLFEDYYGATEKLGTIIDDFKT